MSTDLVSPLPLVLSAEGYLDFRSPEWPFSGGEYYVMSSVESDEEVQDWVHSAGLLPIVDGDFYGTGKSDPPKWKGKSVLIKSQ